MHWFRAWLGCGLFCLTLWNLAPVRAEGPPDPLRLVPRQADLVVEVPQPRQLLESFLNLQQRQQLQSLAVVQELHDSTNFRRFQQLVAYYEKQLGMTWPQVLDRLTGGGAVLAVQYGPDPAPGLFVIQGSDPELLHQFYRLSLEVIDQELARQEAKDRLEKSHYRDQETVHIGPKFFAAVAGSALLISNTEKGLEAGLDHYLDGDQDNLSQSASVKAARNLLPPRPLAWMWLNLDYVHRSPQAKDLFSLPRNDAFQTVLFGGWLDVAGRAPFLCAGLYKQHHGFLTTVRMPRGREGMPAALALHVPPAGQPGSLPLLEPKGVLFSSSYYLDLSRLWEDRASLFNAQQIKGLEDLNKNSAKFLVGNRLEELLRELGPHHRLVAANQFQTGYRPMTTREGDPTPSIPAFALVVDMRNPEAFSKAMNTILRGAALLAGFQVKIKLVEEKHGDATIVGYRFAEDAEMKQDVNSIRFNFSPCFVRVGNQFVVSSTLELARNLVDLLAEEARHPERSGNPATEQTQFYSAGAADALQAIEDRLLVQTILSQALSPEEAHRQVRIFIDWVRHLGVLRLESDYNARDFHYDVRLVLEK